MNRPDKNYNDADAVHRCITEIGLNPSPDDIQRAADKYDVHAGTVRRWLNDYKDANEAFTSSPKERGNVDKQGPTARLKMKGGVEKEKTTPLLRGAGQEGTGYVPMGPEAHDVEDDARALVDVLAGFFDEIDETSIPGLESDSEPTKPKPVPEHTKKALSKSYAVILERHGGKAVRYLPYGIAIGLTLTTFVPRVIQFYRWIQHNFAERLQEYQDQGLIPQGPTVFVDEETGEILNPPSTQDEDLEAGQRFLDQLDKGVKTRGERKS